MKKEKVCFSFFFSVTPLPSETYITYNKMFSTSPSPHLPPIFRSTAHSEKNRPPRETNPIPHNRFIIISNLKEWMPT